VDNSPHDASDGGDAPGGATTAADRGASSAAPPVPGSSPAVRVVHKPRRMPGDRGPAPRIALTWATFFGAGYFPVAPGTAGTAAAIPLWWALTHLSWPLYIAATVVLTLTGIAAADRAGRYYGVADSGHIVIDEVAGYLVTMLFLPRTALAAIVGFFLFRLCDVLKPPPAGFFDRDPRWKNGAGVVLDDVTAAVWSWVATWLIVVAASRLGLT
jgi:phosphatidylglycerophosphatase A